MNIAIICAEFNPEITGAMKKEAKKKAKELGAKVSCVYSVPGVFDIPFALKKALKRKDVDCAAVMGAAIKGQTDHDRLIIDVAAEKIASLSLEFEKPVGLGIIGPGATWEKAKKRAEEYGQRAVEAAVKMCKL